VAKALADLQDLTQPQRAALGAVEADEKLRETFYLTGGTLLKALGIVLLANQTTWIFLPSPTLIL